MANTVIRWWSEPAGKEGDRVSEAVDDPKGGQADRAVEAANHPVARGGEEGKAASSSASEGERKTSTCQFALSRFYFVGRVEISRLTATEPPGP